MTDNQNTRISLDVQNAYDRASLQNYDRDIVTANLLDEIVNIPSFEQEMKNIVSDSFVDYLYQKRSIEIRSLPWGEKKQLIENLTQKFADAMFLSVHDEIIEAFNKDADDEYEKLLNEDRYSEAA